LSITIDPTTLSSHFDPKEAEERWERLWREWEVHRFDDAGEGEAYVIDTPPPTVSGSLHVGHVFSYTQTAVLARHHRMRGKNVFYPMGWDDNGLPTERRVQNFYHVRCEAHLRYEPGLHLAMPDDAARKQPPRRISRANFIELCLALTAEERAGPSGRPRRPSWSSCAKRPRARRARGKPRSCPSRSPSSTR
jgi:valyl-tRNA synthetase